MTINRRSLLALAAGAVASDAAFKPVAARAADFPSKPVKLMVGFAAGGGNDRIARMMAPYLSKKWGQPVVVENMEGADATIAADYVAKSPNDGHTLLMINTNQASTPSLRKLPFDPVKDFAFITVIAAAPEVMLVHPSFEAKTVKDLIRIAKEKPGSVNFGSTGPGGPQFLEMAQFMRSAGVQLKPIPYKGSGAALPALLGGEIQLMFQNSLAASSSLSNGTLRALAITGVARSPALPDVPTFREAAGIEDLDDLATWYGVAAPGGTPKEVVAKIYADVSEVMKMPENEKAMVSGGSVMVLSSPEEITAKITHEIADYAQLLAQFNK